MQIRLHGASVYIYTGTKSLVPAQPAVMFIHGAANDHSVWTLQSRYFAYHGHNVLAVDLPAHGRSGGEPLRSIEAMAQWCTALLDAVGVEKAALVGHSMGSLIALHAAAAAPARVEKLALVGTAFPMKVSDALLQAAEAEDHAALEMINVWSHSAAGQAGGNRAPGQWIMGGSMRLLERTATPLHTDFSACNSYTAGLEAAGKIQCPALFISGERDVMTPARSAKSLIERMPRAKAVTLSGCGHDLMAEQPDAVLDALIAFMR